MVHHGTLREVRHLLLDGQYFAVTTSNSTGQVREMMIHLDNHQLRWFEVMAELRYAHWDDRLPSGVRVFTKLLTTGFAYAPTSDRGDWSEVNVNRQVLVNIVGL